MDAIKIISHLHDKLEDLYLSVECNVSGDKYQDWYNRKFHDEIEAALQEAEIALGMRKPQTLEPATF